MEEEARQEIVNGEQLRIIRMGYFVAGGMAAFISLLGFFYAFMGFFLFQAISRIPQQPGQPEFPDFIGKFFGVFGLVFALLSLTIAALQFLTGQRLKARRSRGFCMVIAVLTCLWIPAGTFLGVCTLIVLSRPSVQSGFQQGG